MQKAPSSGSAGRGRAGPLPSSPAAYFILQVFVAFAEQPHTPMILRVDEGCRGRAVVEQALGKYGELLDAANDPETTAAYAPPSISSDDYILRVALGDGTVDLAAAPLDAEGGMKEQGLQFPYMVVLMLDPARDPADMQLTEQYRERTSRRAGPSAAFDQTNQSLSALSLTASPEQKTRERAAMEAFQEEQWNRAKMDSLREQQVQRIERERQEKERLHLEDCEKKERERRRKLVEQRQEEEMRQFQFLEEQHQRAMAQRVEEYVREQEKKEALERHQKEMEREEQERRRRHEALERERQRRQAERELTKLDEEAERQQARDAGRELRMQYAISGVLDQLEFEIQMDTRKRLELLERERLEREAEERMLYEREYIAKVERQRKLLKDKQTQERLAKEERRQAELLEKARQEAEARRRAEEEERERFEAWRAKRRANMERTFRQAELDVLSSLAAETVPSRRIAADSL